MDLTTIRILLVVSLLASGQGQSPTYSSHTVPDPDFDAVEELVTVLETEAEVLLQEIGTVSTLCHVDQERINLIQNKYIPLFNLKNQQQDALAELLAAQAKELQHRTDAAQAAVDGVIQRASETSSEIAHSQNEVSQESNTNHVQQTTIGELENRLSTIKNLTLDALSANITTLSLSVDERREEISEIAEFVQSRKCEYGYVPVCPGELANVTFKSRFNDTPSISLALTGFKAHLDGHTYDPDCLGFNATVVDPSTEGFSVEAPDGSSGHVTLGHLIYRYMACQNLTKRPKDLLDCTQADVVFVLDQSGSIGNADFNMLRDFVKDIVSQLTIGPDDIQIGALKFSNDAVLQFNLNSFDNQAGVHSAIDAITNDGGETRTDLGLDFLLSDMFTPANGDRPGVPNIAIVITDGGSSRPSDTQDSASNVRDAGIRLLAVGVGSGVNVAELKGIASDPDADNVFLVDSFGALGTIVSTIWAQVCE